jgi:hypothetical protein
MRIVPAFARRQAGASTWDCTVRRHPQVDSRDVDAVQHEESLTAADRVDLIANRVVSERDDTPEVGEKH